MVGVFGIILSFLLLSLPAFSHQNENCPAGILKSGIAYVVDRLGERIGGSLAVRNGSLWFFPRMAEGILIARIPDGERPAFDEGVTYHAGVITLHRFEVAK